MKTIPAVIAHYRNPQALQKTLDYLSKQTVPTQFFVRDNSLDNVLFTRAVNEGLRRFCFDGQHDFVLVLNHDAYLAPDCVAHMLDVMARNPTCGIVTPVAIDMAGQVTWAGGLQAYPFGVHRCEPLESLHDPEIETPWANGACMLLRVQMVHEIGLLDENMQFVFSDSDYAFTARARGWSVLVSTLALMVHTLQASNHREDDPALEQIMRMDQLYFAEKWLSGDVYRRLAAEGSTLTPSRVDELLMQTKMALGSVADWGDVATGVDRNRTA